MSRVLAGGCWHVFLCPCASHRSNRRPHHPRSSFQPLWSAPQTLQLSAFRHRRRQCLCVLIRCQRPFHAAGSPRAWVPACVGPFLFAAERRSRVGIWPVWVRARGLLASLTRIALSPSLTRVALSLQRLQSGTTGVCALIAGNTLHVAWLGDSQVLLVRQGQAVKLMEPHRPERQVRGPHPPGGLQALLQREGAPLRSSRSPKAGCAGRQESHRALPVSATWSPELQDGAGYLLAGGPGGRVNAQSSPAQAGSIGLWGRPQAVVAPGRSWEGPGLGQRARRRCWGCEHMQTLWQVRPSRRPEDREGGGAGAAAETPDTLGREPGSLRNSGASRGLAGGRVAGKLSGSSGEGLPVKARGAKRKGLGFRDAESRRPWHPGGRPWLWPEAPELAVGCSLRVWGLEGLQDTHTHP